MNRVAPCFHSLFGIKTGKKQKQKRYELQIENERKLIDWMVDSQYASLLQGSLSLSMKKSEADNMVTALLKTCTDLDSFYDKHRLLSSVIIYGNKKLACNIPIPPPLIELPRSIPILIEQDFLELKVFRDLKAAFDKSLISISELTNHERSGQILFSAIANGALLNSDKQMALMESNPDQWVVTEFATWVDLVWAKRSARKIPIKDRSEDDYKTNRWFPDPITEKLILRWFEDFGDHPWFEVPNKYQTVKSLLRNFGCSSAQIPSSLSKFSSIARIKLATQLPPFMVSIANDKLPSTTLPKETWLRLYKGVRVRAEPKDRDTTSQSFKIIDVSNKEFEMVPLSIQKKYCDKILKALNMPTHQKRISTLRANLNSHESPSFITWLIGAFMFHLVKNGGQSKNRLTSDALKRYFSAIRKPLLGAFADVDASQLGESSWLSLLQKAIDVRTDQMTPNRIADFASFIQHIDLVPAFDVNELEGPDIDKRVNANIVTYSEFETALVEFQPIERLKKMQRLSAALAFYCGLRCGEVMSLMLSDLAGFSAPELLVRSNQYDDTKYRTSRRLPLHALLPESLLNELMTFYRARLVEENIDPIEGGLGHQILFCHAESSLTMLSYAELITPFIEVLRNVTGDKTLVHHNLRHSFANNTMLKMLIPEYPHIRRKGVAFLEHPEFDVESCKKLKASLLPATKEKGDISVRDALYLLAQLMPHSTPEVTVKSYLHLFDWIIHACLSGRYLDIEQDQLRSLLGVESKYWHEFIKMEKFYG